MTRRIAEGPTWRVIAVALATLLLTVGGVLWSTVIYGQGQANAKAISELRDNLGARGEELVEQRADVRHIRDDMKRIEGKVDALGDKLDRFVERVTR